MSAASHRNVAGALYNTIIDSNRAHDEAGCSGLVEQRVGMVTWFGISLYVELLKKKTKK